MKVLYCEANRGDLSRFHLAPTAPAPHLCYLTPFPPLSICIVLNLNELNSLLPLAGESKATYPSLHLLRYAHITLRHSPLALQRAPPRKHTLAAE